MFNDCIEINLHSMMAIPSVLPGCQNLSSGKFAKFAQFGRKILTWQWKFYLTVCGVRLYNTLVSCVLNDQLTENHSRPEFQGCHIAVLIAKKTPNLAFREWCWRTTFKKKRQTAVCYYFRVLLQVTLRFPPKCIFLHNFHRIWGNTFNVGLWPKP